MKQGIPLSLRGVGIVALLCASLGLTYNLTGLANSAVFRTPSHSQKFPFFFPAYYTMTAVCVICYLLLAICGIQFLRGRVRWVLTFVPLMTFEVVYVFAISALWMSPSIGLSVGAATGVANGGLLFQFLIWFPLWGSVLACLAKRKLERRVEAIG